jgi:hypothetical protein
MTGNGDVGLRAAGRRLISQWDLAAAAALLYSCQCSAGLGDLE